jgi:hypothetical protein
MIEEKDVADFAPPAPVFRVQISLFRSRTSLPSAGLEARAPDFRSFHLFSS